MWQVKFRKAASGNQVNIKILYLEDEKYYVLMFYAKHGTFAYSRYVLKVRRRLFCK